MKNHKNFLQQYKNGGLSTLGIGVFQAKSAPALGQTQAFAPPKNKPGLKL